ncbi:SDR family NAD(P)-dependent oxidoreductase [Rhodococcus fascians]|nr:SDR family NAD(P)-dependent oxidoreductase [Rhodococcus fascians]MBY3995241.1 SDR family NAD(P)-dependent oxidoreductase [Rhodococcus fascians]MBY4000439.1 SDR family NAD(P)-dependent oxidoreductase [Rhodococcus fascians]MBY4005467.1 SDR family NAD(P)-dependent oxidoreductase [Rhodococcus fascians]MBY4016300.1 SDR family NAD(P)-dependent oxidoreductase [Rhodococcus fascians]
MLTGRTALITGGAQGIGLAIATLFAANGANIVLADLNEEAARQAAASLTTPAHGVRCDVTSAGDVEVDFPNTFLAA